MRLYASRLKLLNQSILILTAPSVRRPGLELDPWRKKCQQKPSRTGPDIRRRPTQSYEVAAQLKSVSPRVWSGITAGSDSQILTLRSQRVVTAPGEPWQESASGYMKDLDLCLSWLAGATFPRCVSVKLLRP